MFWWSKKEKQPTTPPAPQVPKPAPGRPAPGARPAGDEGIINVHAKTGGSQVPHLLSPTASPSSAPSLVPFDLLYKTPAPTLYRYNEPIERNQEGITFKVSSVEREKDHSRKQPVTDFKEFVEKSNLKKQLAKDGRLLLHSEPTPITKGGDADLSFLHPRGDTSNGFVNAATTAYSYHYHLIIKPDDVWIAITTSLARHINANAEELRPVFVNHSGQKELVAVGSGDLLTARYDDLVDQLTRQLDENTNENVVPWMTCNFSTTTPKEQFVSKLVLMGAMKKYFSYHMELQCGLPAVTLEGTVEDWKEIRNRVDKMNEWSGALSKWSEVLGFVLDEFVRSAEGLPDTDFWNRIVTTEGGGSGPSYLQGWLLAFIGFDVRGRYVLNDLAEIKETNTYGNFDFNDIPHAVVDVPVKIKVNSKVHETIFFAGLHAATFSKEKGITRPSIDWALVDVTKD